MDEQQFYEMMNPTIANNTSMIIDSGPRCRDGSTVNNLIASFIKAKFAITQSTKTAKAYFDTVVGFRKYLLSQGDDLIAETKGQLIDEVDMYRVRIAEYARSYSILSATPGRLVSHSTRNQRLAILSSFYVYAEQNLKIAFANPIVLVQRSKVEAYATAKSLEPAEISHTLIKLASKFEKSIQEKRDLAILALLFATGRRANEIVQLRLNDVRIATIRVKHNESELEYDAEQVTLSFLHMKRGKALTMPLDIDISAYLLDYLRSYYGAELYTLTNAPVWVNLSTVPLNAKQQTKWEDTGKPRHIPLGYQAVREICRDSMHFTKVHTTRHSFTRLLKMAGATLEERQSLLGHSSPVTTQLYDKQDDRGSTKYTAKVAGMLGLKNQGGKS